MIASDVWIWSNLFVWKSEDCTVRPFYRPAFVGPMFVPVPYIYLDVGLFQVTLKITENMQAQFFCIESHDDHWKGFWRVDVEKCCLEKLRYEKNSIHVNKKSCETFFFWRTKMVAWWFLSKKASIKAHQQYYFETEVRHFLKYVKYLDSIERVLSCSMISWSNHNWFSSYLTRTKPIYIILSFLYLCNQSRRL